MKYLQKIFVTGLLLILTACSGQFSDSANQPASSSNQQPVTSISTPSPPPKLVTKIPVLMFHYVRTVDRKQDPLGYNLSIEPDSFEEILKYLQAEGYHTIHAADLLQKSVPEKSIILTFDDGYEDFYTTAWPLLQKYNFTATEAIITSKMDGKQYMTPEQVRKLDQEGIEFLSHTVHHLDLATSAAATVATEVSASKSILEKLLGHPVIGLIYPSGRYNLNTIKTLQENNYKLAFTTKPGKADLTKNIFELPRIRIDNRVSLNFLIKQL